MSDLIKWAQGLKSRAMDARNKGDFRLAIIRIEEAENGLRKAHEDLRQRREIASREGDVQKPGVFEIKIAEQLGHILGSKGGIYRWSEQYPESIACYDDGFTFEKWVSGYGIVNSYDLVQRLVARVFLNPKAACDNSEVVGLPLRSELIRAKSEVERQLYGHDEKSVAEQIRLGVRGDDDYAAADLALVCVLLGDALWESALNSFIHSNPSPQQYAVGATLQVVNDLSTAFVKKLNSPPDLADRLARTSQQLDDTLQRLKSARAPI